jgi:hypothetical protein
MSGKTGFVALLREMLRKQGARTLALAGWAVWACALPTNNAPPTAGAGAGGASGGGGTGNTAAGVNGGTGGKAGGTTGGTAGSTGGSVTGGTAGSTGGSVTGGTAGSSTGGTVGGAGTGTGGTAGSMAGAGTGGSMGGAGSAGKAGGGTGGSMGGAGSGGKGGTAGTGGMPGVLRHRYSFSGTDTVALDSAGGRNGTIVGGTQSGGVVTLAGGTSEQYVALPAGMISVLTNATFEAWVTWTGGTTNWQRVFDFGTNDGAQGEQGIGSAYFFFTTRASAAGSGTCTAAANFPRVAITPSNAASETCVADSTAFPTGLTHVAVTIGSTMSLYINGQSVGSPVAPAVNLSGLADTNNWLGRSQYNADTEFAGSISEFRIYPTERSASQISASASAGPDSVPSQ